MHSDGFVGVDELLQGYADRGVFRAFSKVPAAEGAFFRVLWHYGRAFEIVISSSSKTVAIPSMLPEVDRYPIVRRNLAKFLRQFASPKLPEHRRVSRERATLHVRLIRGDITCEMRVKGEEYVYATQKLVNVVQEVFLVFLQDSVYSEYKVDVLNIDPDVAWP
jgi:hypothetical protein